MLKEFIRHPDTGIADGYADVGEILARRSVFLKCDHHLVAGICVFDRVARQVQHDLPDTNRVANHVLALDVLQDEFGIEFFLIDLRLVDGGKLLDQIGQRESVFRQGGFATFDPIHIKHIVDQLQKMMR